MFLSEDNCLSHCHHLDTKKQLVDCLHTLSHAHFFTDEKNSL